MLDRTTSTGGCRRCGIESNDGRAQGVTELGESFNAWIGSLDPAGQDEHGDQHCGEDRSQGDHEEHQRILTMGGTTHHLDDIVEPGVVLQEQVEVQEIIGGQRRA